VTAEIIEDAGNNEARPQIRNEAWLEDRRQCEALAAQVVETYGQKCLAVLVLPHSSGITPLGVICPSPPDMTLNTDQLHEAIQGKEIAFLSCSFAYQEEQEAAFRIAPQLAALTPRVFVLVGQTSVPIGMPSQTHMRLHEDLLNAGVDDIICDIMTPESQVRLRIKVAHCCFTTNQDRLRLMIAQEPPLPPQAEIDALRQQHQQLLFHDIPRALMPEFSTKDDNLIEAETNGEISGVGEYTFTSKMATYFGHVYEAKDQDGRRVAVKLWEKVNTFTPGEVEGIHRELRFLKGFTRHPNVVRALKFLHGPKNVYLVMEYVGQQNLSQYLSDLPGQRMSAEESLNFFHQISDGLLHCHEKDIAHRSLSLEHVVLRHLDDGQILPKLVDFHAAVLARNSVQCKSICGTLPCMSPEVLSGEAYLPKTADLWSVAVILLEMAGGKGSLLMAVGLDEAQMRPDHLHEQIERARISAAIFQYFDENNSHARALAKIGNVQNETVLERLKSLLQPEAQRGMLAPLIPTRVAPDAMPEEHISDRQPS
jgi:hypothetical protein